MRRCLTVAVAMMAAAALTVGSSSAAIVTQLGRTERDYFHLGNPSLGAFRVAVAGELTDSDEDGTADSLGGATRMTKVRRVLRLQVDLISLQRNIGGVWQTEAIADEANSGTASSVLLKTPRVGFCETATANRLYRIMQVGSVRWSDGRLGHQTQFSGQFLAQILNDDPDCPPPPPADLSLTKTASDNEVTGPDQTYTYTLTVHNAGPAVAINAEVTDDWPAGLNAPTGLPSGCTFSSSFVYCALGNLGVNATVTRTLNARTNNAVTAFESIDNSATVGSQTGDLDADDNTDTASVIVTL